MTSSSSSGSTPSQPDSHRARNRLARGVTHRSAIQDGHTLFGVVLLLVALLGFTGIDLVHTLLNITESTDPDNFPSPRDRGARALLRDGR